MDFKQLRNYFVFLLIIVVGVAVASSSSVALPQAMGEEKQEPLKLDNFASELWYDHEFIIDGTILDIRGFDKPERTYDIQINSFFKPKEGTNTKLITVNGCSKLLQHQRRQRNFLYQKGGFAMGIWETMRPRLPQNVYQNSCITTLRLIDPPLVRGPPPMDFDMIVDCYPHYYKKYLPQYMKARGATEFPSPRIQSIDGVLPQEIVCNGILRFSSKT